MTVEINFTFSTGDVSRILQGLRQQIHFRVGYERQECERLFNSVERASHQQIEQARISEQSPQWPTEAA